MGRTEVPSKLQEDLFNWYSCVSTKNLDRATSAFRASRVLELHTGTRAKAESYEKRGGARPRIKGVHRELV